MLLKNDNITLFLFIILSATIYTIDKNMIMVLGIPLVITSILLLLKYFFLPKMNEGFDSMENFDENDFIQWSKDYFNNDKKYLEYTEEISNKGSLKDVVSNLLNNEDETKNTTFLNYMLEIFSMEKTDEQYNNEQVIYVRGIIKMYINEKDEKEETQKIEEENVDITEKIQELETKEEDEDVSEKINEEEIQGQEIQSEEIEQNENIESFIGKYTLF